MEPADDTVWTIQMKKGLRELFEEQALKSHNCGWSQKLLDLRHSYLFVQERTERQGKKWEHGAFKVIDAFLSSISRHFQ